MIKKIFVNCKEPYGHELKNQVKKIVKDLGIKYSERNTKDVGLAVLIGGDGTFLKYQWRFRCPVMGVNPGSSVGFYMTSGPKDFKRNLILAINGEEGKDYFIHEMTRLETSVNGKTVKPLALNDVLVSAIYTRRILDSEIRVNGKTTNERGSGILVYTPTGSNAFAHSAGAKRMKWNSIGFGVMETAPFTGRLKEGEILTDKEVTIRCLNREGELCIDGQEDQVRRLREKDIVSVRKSGSPARIVGFRKEFSNGIKNFL
ncbi:MAG: NAD(+)/NADH kinase [Candidatus Aenigmarchaeota archaeon]|nr:NAD(+)/NADH kinase [Candidatus Aenigmarchaeota archaeon]